jgi:hypothetical protein
VSPIADYVLEYRLDYVNAEQEERGVNEVSNLSRAFCKTVNYLSGYQRVKEIADCYYHGGKHIKNE